MQHAPRQDAPSPSDLITSLLSSASSIISSDVSLEPTSEPTSLPPSSIETSLPPTSEPTSAPPSSDPTSLPPSSDITSDPPPTNDIPSTTPPTPPPTPTPFLPSSSAPVPENITTIVTSVSGQLTTFTSSLPTSLVESSPKNSTSQRTAIIAGTTAGLIGFVLVLLVAIFVYRKRKLNKFLQESGRRKEVKGLLDGEEFYDDDVAGHPHMRSQSRASVAVGATSAARLRTGSPAPGLLKSRTSESGSIFREEVWPPPGFVDPISQNSSQVDLSRIVDDVMGPAEHGHRIASASGSNTSYLGLPSSSHGRGHTDASTTSTTSSQFSTNSSVPLRPSSATYTDPFRSSPSLHSSSALPPGASPPIPPGSPVLATTSKLSPTIPTTSARARPTSSGGTLYPPIAPPAGSSQSTSLQPSPLKTSQPLKSSPLARALTEDTRIWLGRPLHHPDRTSKFPDP
ncbi:hypothetical protein NLJ89_g2696 [Agrocybe chaxingu]|uniref:Uncharacterized protein n=1 Tax=Agrocybe chaxingu TaxID=84603 RepID=A0A9W8K5F1_9AGAR|nr:hypothetical protein NLJ89_g2696 [Agrocybe chaxingu]